MIWTGKIRATNFVQKKEAEHVEPKLVAQPVVKLPTAETFGLTEAKEERLSEIIAEINSHTGRAYDTDVAVKAMLQIRDILLKSEKLQASAKSNTVKDFGFSYFDDIDDALIEGLSQNQDFFSPLLNNEELKRQVLGICIEEIYKSLRDAQMDSVIYFPEFEQLKIEVEKLRTELSMLVQERDELLYVECKNIEMLYMLKLGALEYKAYEAQCAMLRMKRKLELIQAKRNRQEKIDLTVIEAALDEEFAEYQERLEEQLCKMNDAIDRSHAKALTEQETKELKRLYRRVVKRLHPDLNPELSEEKQQLFLRAVSAYECGDLNTLRIIDEMAGDPVLPEETPDALGSLRQERDRLYALLDDIKAGIVRIKSEYPYTVKEIVQDETKVDECRRQLEELLAQYQQAVAYYKARINEIVG